MYMQSLSQLSTQAFIATLFCQFLAQQSGAFLINPPILPRLADLSSHIPHRQHPLFVSRSISSYRDKLVIGKFRQRIRDDICAASLKNETSLHLRCHKSNNLEELRLDPEDEYLNGTYRAALRYLTQGVYGPIDALQRTEVPGLSTRMPWIYPYREQAFPLSRSYCSPAFAQQAWCHSIDPSYLGLMVENAQDR